MSMKQNGERVIELKKAMEELEKLLWFLSYNFRKLTCEKIKEEFEDRYCLQRNIQFTLIDKTSYSLSGKCKVIVNHSSDMRTDLINFATSVTSALYGQNNEVVKSQEFYNNIIKNSIESPLKMGLFDYMDAKKASEEFDYYYSSGI